jgi:hypothetical protein
VSIFDVDTSAVFRRLYPIPLAPLTFIALLALSACHRDGSSTINPPSFCTGAPAPTTLTISGYAPNDGAFDPSLTEDACNRVWMSYSAVSNSASGLRLVHARIARGNSVGTGWDDMNIGATPFNVNTEDVVNPVGPLMGTWEHEVSRLVYDPYTSDPNQRWKILWHRYRFEQMTVGSVGSPRFERGWISLSTAPNATGPWSAERKLFVGSAYDFDPADKAYNDSFIGLPEYELDNLVPALSTCLVFTEPGMLATANGIYISLKCATGAGGSGDVILMRCDNQFSIGSCNYPGTPLSGTEAARYNGTFAGGNAFTGFSATELVRAGGRDFLLVTPTEGDIYRGCLAFEIDDLDSATLVRDAASLLTPKLAILSTSLRGTPGSFNGACGYTQANTSLGILYSELSAITPHFTIQSSGYQLPP